MAYAEKTSILPTLTTELPRPTTHYTLGEQITYAGTSGAPASLDVLATAAENNKEEKCVLEMWLWKLKEESTSLKTYLQRMLLNIKVMFQRWET